MFGRRLKYLRMDHDMTQEELGKMVGVSKATISTYETESRIPDAHMLAQLADVFNVSVDYILGRSNEKKIVTNKNGLSPDAVREAAQELSIKEIGEIIDYINFIKSKKSNKDDDDDGSIMPPDKELAS